MIITDHFKKLIGSLTTPDTIKLTHTVKVTEFDDDQLKIVLNELYKNSYTPTVLIASLINSIMTHRLRTFMLSKRIMDNLLSFDDNVETNSCRSNNYKDFLYKVINNNLLKVLRKPARNKAGIFRLEEPELLNILYKIHSTEYYKIQEEAALKFYDTYDERKALEKGEKISKNVLDVLSIEEINAIGKMRRKREGKNE